MTGSCWALVSPKVPADAYLAITIALATTDGSEKSVGVIVRIITIIELQYGTWCICVGYDLRQNEDRRTKHDRGRQQPPAAFECTTSSRQRA